MDFKPDDLAFNKAHAALWLTEASDAAAVQHDGNGGSRWSSAYTMTPGFT